MIGERGEKRQVGFNNEQTSIVSRIIDCKNETELTAEERFDKKHGDERLLGNREMEGG